MLWEQSTSCVSCNGCAGQYSISAAAQQLEALLQSTLRQACQAGSAEQASSLCSAVGDAAVLLAALPPLVHASRFQVLQCCPMTAVIVPKLGHEVVVTQNCMPSPGRMNPAPCRSPTVCMHMRCTCHATDGRRWSLCEGLASATRICLAKDRQANMQAWARL